MAYSYIDPKSGVKRDRYGNETTLYRAVPDRPDDTSHWPWVVGMAFAGFLALILFSVSTLDDRSTSRPTERAPLTKAQPSTML